VDAEPLSLMPPSPLPASPRKVSAVSNDDENQESPFIPF
jgi:hypothetical protein